MATVLQSIATKRRRRAICRIREQNRRRYRSRVHRICDGIKAYGSLSLISQAGTVNGDRIENVGRLAIRRSDNTVDVLGYGSSSGAWHTLSLGDHIPEGLTTILRRNTVSRVDFQRLAIDHRILAPFINGSLDLHRLTDVRFEFCNFGGAPAGDLQKFAANLTAAGLAATVDYCRHADRLLDAITNHVPSLSSLTVRRRVDEPSRPLGDAALRRWAADGTLRRLDLDDSCNFTFDAVLEFLRTRISVAPADFGRYNFGHIRVPYDTFEKRLQCSCDPNTGDTVFRLRCGTSLALRLVDQQHVGGQLTLRLAGGRSDGQHQPRGFERIDFSISPADPASTVRQLFDENFLGQKFPAPPFLSRDYAAQLVVELCGVGT